MSGEFTQYREPTETELYLLEQLSIACGLPSQWVEGVRVRPLSDDGMGSLELRPLNVAASGRRFGCAASELNYDDIDGVRVLVTLNLDQEGQPFELDVWKTNFEKVVQWPEPPRSSRR
jgi:hypothetical protein